MAIDLWKPPYELTNHILETSDVAAGPGTGTAGAGEDSRSWLDDVRRRNAAPVLGFMEVVSPKYGDNMD